MTLKGILYRLGIMAGGALYTFVGVLAICKVLIWLEPFLDRAWEKYEKS